MPSEILASPPSARANNIPQIQHALHSVEEAHLRPDRRVVPAFIFLPPKLLFQTDFSSEVALWSECCTFSGIGPLDPGPIVQWMELREVSEMRAGGLIPIKAEAEPCTAEGTHSQAGKAANCAFNEMATYCAERDGHGQARSLWLSGKQQGARIADSVESIDPSVSYT